MQPVFSVIVPIYKVEDYLRECVDSILAQSYRDFELILVDDGSPDGCPAICDEYARADSRVRVIHKENGGQAAARHSGLELARGEYIGFVDSDDWVAPDWLATLQRILLEADRPDVILFGNIRVFGARTEASLLKPASGFYSKERLEREIYPRMIYDRSQPFLRNVLPAMVWNKAAKKDLLAAHFADDPRIQIFEDSAMAYECMYFARSAYFCPECLYYYRQREQSIMNRYQPGYIENAAALREYLIEHLGTLDRDLEEQINAYIVYAAINAILHEFLHQKSFRQAVRHIRREMERTGLTARLRFAGLPPYIRLYVLLLKLRFYTLAVWTAKLRLSAATDA